MSTFATIHSLPRSTPRRSLSLPARARAATTSVRLVTSSWSRPGPGTTPSPGFTYLIRSINRKGSCPHSLPLPSPSSPLAPPSNPHRSHSVAPLPLHFRRHPCRPGAAQPPRGEVGEGRGRQAGGLGWGGPRPGPAQCGGMEGRDSRGRDQAEKGRVAPLPNPSPLAPPPLLAAFASSTRAASMPLQSAGVPAGRVPSRHCSAAVLAADSGPSPLTSPTAFTGLPEPIGPGVD